MGFQMINSNTLHIQSIASKNIWSWEAERALLLVVIQAGELIANSLNEDGLNVMIDTIQVDPYFYFFEGLDIDVAYSVVPDPPIKFWGGLFDKKREFMKPVLNGNGEWFTLHCPFLVSVAQNDNRSGFVDTIVCYSQKLKTDYAEVDYKTRIKTHLKTFGGFTLLCGWNAERWN